jgi:hypothetical protein
MLFMRERRLKNIHMIVAKTFWVISKLVITVGKPLRHGGSTGTSGYSNHH